MGNDQLDVIRRQAGAFNHAGGGILHAGNCLAEGLLSQKLKNILNEKFNPEHPDAVWCSDITYIWTYEGFVYLTKQGMLTVPLIDAMVREQQWICPIYSKEGNSAYHARGEDNHIVVPLKGHS